MTLTRRTFMLETAQVAGGVLGASLLGSSPGSAAAAPVRRLQAPPPSLPPSPLHNSDYWAFADWLAAYFDGLWDPDRNYYRSGNSNNGRIYHNSALLTTHAIAALTGHDGLSRQDERARLLARRLCDSPPWSERSSPSIPDPQFHTPGWVESMNTTDASMDKSIDPKVAEALAYAWRARDTLDLPPETRDLIQDRISRCARGQFFRYPNVRLNQINWHCEMYAHLATVSDDKELLVNDYRAQVARFVTYIGQPLVSGGSPNLGPGYRFHYLPQRPPHHPLNLDSAEYANMTCHFLLHYERALRAGMTPLATDEVRVLRAWVQHILCGYWTHAGYLNWDTGWSYKRWHIGRTYSLARQGLMAILLSPRFHAIPELGRWAKYILDAGFGLYERLSVSAPDGAGIAPAVLFGLKTNLLGPSVRELFAARMQAEAARAVAAGLEAMESAPPPPLYSFDADIGRLAVTTPSYSTALLPVSQGATPYGGIELARLYDGAQRVVSNIAGRPWACFGVVVRDQHARVVLKSQQARGQPDPGRPPLVLLESPRGAVELAVPYSAKPYAGAFNTLVARGTIETLEARVETTHRFKAEWIETRWRIERKDRGRYTVDVLFPSWGRRAQVEAVRRGGRRTTLAAPGVKRRRTSLRDLDYFYLAGEQAGYVIVPIFRQPGRAISHIVKPKPQSASPEPGPTLLIELAGQTAFKPLNFAVRIAPVSSPEQAAQVARRLRRSLPIRRPRPHRRRRSRRGGARRR